MPPPARVLIVDDEPDVVSTLRDLLGGLLGLSVEAAHGFREGLARVEGEPWDLVISDERMPDGSGCDLLAAAAAQRPGARRMLMTAYVDTIVTVRAINVAHADYYMQKPWDPEEMLRAVEALAAGRLAPAQGTVG